MTTKKNGNSINKYVAGTAHQWKEQARNYKKNRKQIRRAQKFAIELMEYMEESGIKQKELALLMDVSPQQVNKILRAKANLTFDTIDKIEKALNVEITSPKIKKRRVLDSPIVTNTMTIAYKKGKIIEEVMSTPIASSRSSELETTIETMNAYRYTADQI